MPNQQHERRRSVPKFGEWDVKNPASADGFTVIFDRVRDEKKTGVSHVTSNTHQNAPAESAQQRKYDIYIDNNDNYNYYSRKKRWFCCG